MRLKLKIRNICHWYSVGVVVAFIVVCGWDIVTINSQPIQTSHNSITKNNPINKLQTPSSHQNNIQSNHSTQSSSMKTTITNQQPSTTHFIKYENVIYKLTLSTDGKQKRWIYVTPLNSHHHRIVAKGNDVSGHTRRPTGNKRTVMKVSNVTIPITLSTVQHTNNLYQNIINNDNADDTGNVLTKFLKERSDQSGNGKLDVKKLSNIEKLKRATVVRNLKQSNNGVTNEFNDEFKNIDEYRENVQKLFVLPFKSDGNERPFYHIRNGFNTFSKEMFPNDGVMNKNRLPPLIIKNEFVKTVPPENGLSSHAIPVKTASSIVTPFHHQQSNEFTRNDYYRLMEERHRKYSFLKSNFFNHGNEVNGKYGIWVNHNKSLDPVSLQLTFTHHESNLPHFWGIRGYGLYSFAAGNDLHNNLPNGRYKVEPDVDN